MIDFQIFRDRSGAAIITVSGELKASNCDYFFRCVDDLIKEGFREIIIDCEDLGFVSSHCWGRLVASRRRATRQGGFVYLVYLNSFVSNALSLMRLDKLFGVYPTMSAALRKVKRRLAAHPVEPVDMGSKLMTTHLITQ